MADLRHAQVDDIPVDVFLTDPGLALVHADMGAWLEAHPCVCEALCECEPPCELCMREEPCGCGLYKCLCTCGQCEIPPGTPEYERYMALWVRNN